jgi:hypothetical protein
LTTMVPVAATVRAQAVTAAWLGNSPMMYRSVSPKA